MSADPLVTVILPVYNGADTLRDALESVVQQTYSNLEILVVDDGSTDATCAIADAVAARDPRVRVIRQANGGVARARNRALSEARGEFIAPIDADDLWLPEKIEAQVRRMLSAGESTGLVYCWWAWIDASGLVLDRSPHWNIAGSVLSQLVYINFTGNASVPLFRRSALEDVGGYDEGLRAADAGGCEDWDVVLRVANRYSVAVEPRILLGYRRRPGSMSSACDRMWRSQQQVMRGLRQLRPDLKPALFRASENQFAMYLAGVCYWSGRKREACAWGLRAGMRLPLKVSPYVIRLLLFPRRPAKNPQRLEPGKKINAARIPPPLLPYDRMGWGLIAALRIRPLLQVKRAVRWLLLARLRLEAFFSRAGRPRVLAAGDSQFPVYSQTFVYREVLALENAGFNLRLVYAKRKSSDTLPDDCRPLWKLRRWMHLSLDTAARDLRHYQRWMPNQVNDLVRRISAASGLSEEAVLENHYFHFAFSFTRMVEAWKPEYLHTYFFYESALYAFVASTLLGIPRGMTCYTDHMLDDFELKLIRLHLETAAVIVATSANIKTELESIAGKPLPNAVVKPNGIDAILFRASARPPAGAGRVFKAAAVNRIHQKKGVSYLVDAARLLRDRSVPITFHIFGEYDAHDPEGLAYYESLRDFVRVHHLESVVHFEGRREAHQVREQLEGSDIFVAPFVELPNGDKDGIPTALLEAMAAGCAIVTTDAGSIREVISDGAEGLLVPQRDAPALADAVERLVRDEELRERLARAARERASTDFDVRVCEPRFHARVRAALAPPPEVPLGPGCMRIALLSFEYPPETGFGGIGTYTWYHARALTRLGHQVHVLAGATERTVLATTVQEGVLVHRFRPADLWMTCAGWLAALQCYWTRQRLQNAWSMYQGMRLLKNKYKFDVLEMPECGGEGSLLNWLIDIPSIVRFHSPSELIMSFYDVPRMDVILCSAVERLGMQTATRLTSCSRFLAVEAASILEIKQAPVVIPNGIDLPLFDREPVADLTELYGIPRDKVTILFAGRMERRKGIDLCGEIVSTVLSRRDVTFLFAGQDLFGYLETELLPLLNSKKLLGSFFYLGKLGYQQLRATARAVDIYLLPSLWENCPYSCLEAMAAGRAIVASDQGGLPEMIDHGTSGLLATTGSASSFAAHLETLIDNPALRREYGQAARRTVEERFRDSDVAEQTSALYRAEVARFTQRFSRQA